MAKRAFLTSKALNFMFKIRPDEMIQTPITYDGNPTVYGWDYKADLVVDKHPDYPDIPPTTWTVKLSIMDTDGKISKEVGPKDGPKSLKSPHLVLVGWRVRMGRTGEEEEDVNGNPVRGDCYWHVGAKGFEEGPSEPVSGMVDESSLRFHGEDTEHPGLTKDPLAYLFVSLTFIVEKTAARSDLGLLLDSGQFSDCKLICGGRDFAAHRAVLAAQSPVFAAMFHNDMKEKASGICTINDLHPDVLESLLQFVYTRELTKGNEKLYMLWIAADKYDVQDLKTECERLILGSMTDDKAVIYLNFATQNGLNKIVVEAAKVISRRPV